MCAQLFCGYRGVEVGADPFELLPPARDDRFGGGGLGREEAERAQVRERDRLKERRLLAGEGGGGTARCNQAFKR